MRKLRESIDWKGVGRRVRELRGFEKGQREFANAVGLSQGQLSRIERGESEPGAETLLRLSRLCGRTINWLLTGQE